MRTPDTALITFPRSESVFDPESVRLITDTDTHTHSRALAGGRIAVNHINRLGSGSLRTNIVIDEDTNGLASAFPVARLDNFPLMRPN